MEAQIGMFFIIENNLITKEFCREIFIDTWSTYKNYSEKVINSVIVEKQSVCMIDWDNAVEGKALSGVTPEWNSIIAIPLMSYNLVNGVLYLTVPASKKKFTVDELNFVNTLGKMIKWSI